MVSVHALEFEDLLAVTVAVGLAHGAVGAAALLALVGSSPLAIIELSDVEVLLFAGEDVGVDALMARPAAQSVNHQRRHNKTLEEPDTTGRDLFLVWTTLEIWSVSPQRDRCIAPKSAWSGCGNSTSRPFGRRLALTMLGHRVPGHSTNGRIRPNDGVPIHTCEATGWRHRREQAVSVG